MDLLEYLRIANASQTDGLANAPARTRVAVVTNFTDDLIKKTLLGMCVSEGISPEIHGVPYKQYLFALNDPGSDLARHGADVTFMFFDVSPYVTSEFTADPGHALKVLADLRAYARAARGTVVIQTMITPSQTPHGNLFRENALYRLITAWNEGVTALSAESDNVHVLDTDRLVRSLGERQIRDLRSAYAFSQPFSHPFIVGVCREWLSVMRTLAGKTRKCIVVDLDNTLWGGVVGEVGPLGIALGTEYPGNAYREFQRVLLEYNDRGIILAINSRNNLDDVREVFEKNPGMLLRERHFSAIRANWDSKTDNLIAIANELNIGLDSLVFIDDDPMNRDMVRTRLPEVCVPEFSLAPEEYARALLDLNVFHAFRLTDEDKERGRMYAEERQRNAVRQQAPDQETYLATLGIELCVSMNAPQQVQRAAQLTQKTNQFNLTTRRYTEADIAGFMERGSVFAGDVRDKFGPYGVTVLAIVRPLSSSDAELDTLLMSCRVMGRKVETAFFRAVADELASRGIHRLFASFVPTPKNPPAASFLPSLGARELDRQADGAVRYELILSEHLARRGTEAPINVDVIPSIPTSL